MSATSSPGSSSTPHRISTSSAARRRSAVSTQDAYLDAVRRVPVLNEDEIKWRVDFLRRFRGDTRRDRAGPRAGPAGRGRRGGARRPAARRHRQRALRRPHVPAGRRRPARLHRATTARPTRCSRSITTRLLGLTLEEAFPGNVGTETPGRVPARGARRRRLRPGPVRLRRREHRRGLRGARLQLRAAPRVGLLPRRHRETPGRAGAARRQRDAGRRPERRRRRLLELGHPHRRAHLDARVLRALRPPRRRAGERSTPGAPPSTPTTSRRQRRASQQAVDAHACRWRTSTASCCPAAPCAGSALAAPRPTATTANRCAWPASASTSRTASAATRRSAP